MRDVCEQKLRILIIVSKECVVLGFNILLLAAITFSTELYGYCGEHFCEIILILGEKFGGCCSKMYYNC